MSAKFNLVGPNRTRAKISLAGEVVVAPLSYSTAISKTLGTVDTAVNFVKPVAKCRVVITSIFLSANKDVGVADATVILYEASSASSTTVLKTILNLEMLKQTNVNLSGLNLVTSEGVWINAKTNDDDVFVMIGAYRIPANINESLLIE